MFLRTSGGISFTIFDLALESGVLGLFVFAFIFFFFTWKNFRSTGYLAILAFSLVTAVYLIGGIVLKTAVLHGGPLKLTGAMIFLQELCIPWFLAAEAYFWSCFLVKPERLAKINAVLAKAGVAIALISTLLSLVFPGTYLFEVGVYGHSISYKSGFLLFLTRLPVGVFMLYSLIIVVLDLAVWKNLRAQPSLSVAVILSAYFALSSAARSLAGFYIDPLCSLPFSRVVVSLLLFGLFVSFDFIRRFLGEAREVKITHDRLDGLLMTDGLTGLPNRRALVRDLEVLLAGHKKTAVVLIDIDGFNDLNESYGSDLGDTILRSVPRVLVPLLPVGTTFYRMGGDDFAAVIPFGGNRSGIEERILELKDRLRRGLDIYGDIYPLDASFAAAFIPEDGTDPELLLTMIYSCLREAKRERNGVKVFTRLWHEEALNRIETVRALRADLAGGRFHLEYQPIYDAAGCVGAAEVLLRWDSPSRNHGPGVFIPIAESAGLMKDIGRLILDMIAEDFGDLMTAGDGFPCLSVNLSPLQLMDERCIPELMRKVRLLGIEFGRLQWEVTESVFLDRNSSAVGSLRTLREAGSRIAIDDFGSGYSNLGYLRSLPVDKLKLDKFFLQEIPGSATAESLVRSLAGIGTALNLSLLAEGVENETQLAFLKSAGYHEFQGFFFARPLPRDEFLAHLAGAAALKDPQPGR